MELSEKQKKIVESDAIKIVVIAAPASGKTAVLTERLKWLLAHNELPQSIVCITFTNAAAEELQKRIGNISGLFIGTIHSYANKLLMQAGINTSKIRAEEEFDKLFELVKEHPECLQPVEWLLWDEVQDSTNEQYEFLLNVVKPNKFFLVADFRQAIYSFDGGDPNLIIDLSMAPGVTKYDLDENYRNARKIHKFSQDLILSAGWKYRDKSIAMRSEKGEVIKVDYSPTRIVKTIKEYVKEGQSEYRDWFILTRTNKELEEIYRVCRQNDLPCDSFQKDMQDRDKEFKRMMARNTVKAMTIHCAKGLENDNVVVIGARQYNLEEKCVSYVAATRARNLLVWTKRKTPKPEMRRKQQYDTNQLILESFE